ncbi:hypothetical protein M427DRAFT_31971 [Gonapodya prolifera JEL478]|uniref:Transcription factor domain-containing protein n=1 Tax=Gonapodya prolifera (strain JEL478) TaxID=1344416 RepID=A0A139AGV8_GONPJ|nr:hypothetical protein M427DRAFT_31971 [Gonapodya prolifera JEL478]|eukprot:KXS16062.1 hypothetical protein M427DRAFT_31971 [Gonapodya prolifera JEL478]
MPRPGGSWHRAARDQCAEMLAGEWAFAKLADTAQSMRHVRGAGCVGGSTQITGGGQHGRHREACAASARYAATGPDAAQVAHPRVEWAEGWPVRAVIPTDGAHSSETGHIDTSRAIRRARSFRLVSLLPALSALMLPCAQHASSRSPHIARPSSPPHPALPSPPQSLHRESAPVLPHADAASDAHAVSPPHAQAAMADDIDALADSLRRASHASFERRGSVMSQFEDSDASSPDCARKRKRSWRGLSVNSLHQTYGQSSSAPASPQSPPHPPLHLHHQQILHPQVDNFSDTQNVLPPDVCTSLVNVFLAHPPSNSPLIHPCSLLDAPRPHPLLLYGALSIASAVSPDPNMRTLGRWVLSARLRDAVRGAQAIWPTVEYVLGLVHAFYGACIFSKSIKDATQFLSQACATAKLLRITSENGLFNLYPDVSSAGVPAASPVPTWILREQARRATWAVYALDAVVSPCTVGRACMQDEEVWTLGLPCDEAVWAIRRPPTQDPSPARITLKAILEGPQPGSPPFTALTPAPPGRMATQFEPLLLFAYRRVTQLQYRNEIDHDIYAFKLNPTHPSSQRALSQLAEAEMTVDALERFAGDVPGHPETPQGVFCAAAFAAVRATLQGPGTILEWFYVKLIMEPMLASGSERLGQDPLEELARWTEARRPQVTQEGASIVYAWSSSPSFLTAIHHATSTAVLLAQAIEMDPGLAIYVAGGRVKRRISCPTERVFSNSTTILILAAAISRCLGHAPEYTAQLALSAQTIFSIGGPQIDVSDMVSWVVEALQHPNRAVGQLARRKSVVPQHRPGAHDAAIEKLLYEIGKSVGRSA